MEAISLFSGIGGLDLGFQEVFKCSPKIMVEIDPNARAVLKKRFPEVRSLYRDITKVSFRERKVSTDIIYGGFPCTQTSKAGLRTGLEGKDSGLWFEMLRIINEVRPRYIIIEQPEGIINNGLRAILGGLRISGYCNWDIQLISAEEIGAPHQRKRVFIIAYPDHLCQRFREVPTSWNNQIRTVIKELWNDSARRQATPIGDRMDDGVPRWLGRSNIAGHWASRAKSAITYPGMRHHTQKRRECIDAYGKACTPQQATVAFKRIKYLESLTQQLVQ